MPELPEVETVRRGLHELIIGRTVKAAYERDSPKSFPNASSDVKQFLIGAIITDVRRRAKVLLIDLSTDYTLVIHLKMTGQLVFLGAASETPTRVIRNRFGAGHPNESLIGELPDRSTRAVIEFTDGSHLFFNDQRKFGWMKLFPSIEVPNIDFMQKVGPEPLEENFGAKEFTQRIRRRNGTTIKAAILDQTTLAGVGNIYADESLWGAKIHPATRVRDVSDTQLAQLLKEIKYVMNLAIEKGGSTDKNYVNAEGKRGSYMDFARVFRREGLTCPEHPDVIIEKIKVAGRGTHVCPACQPYPKV
jgi:formamidopyrimidine-DNA glycosylase